MTPEQYKIIRLTFVHVMDRKMDAGRIFYERLFAIAPEIKPLFKIDMDLQAEKLMNTLAVAIAGLNDMPSLIMTLEALAKRHVAYGVRDEDYDKVGEALLWMLQQVLGPAFTKDARAAWASLYGTVATVMRNATNGVSARAVAS